MRKGKTLVWVWGGTSPSTRDLSTDRAPELAARLDFSSTLAALLPRYRGRAVLPYPLTLPVSICYIVTDHCTPAIHPLAFVLVPRASH